MNIWKLFEIISPYIIGIIFPLVAFYYKITPDKMANYKELMSATISVGAIAVGFLAAAITLLPSLKDNKVVKQFKQAGTERKLVKYLLSAIVSLFICSLLSVIGLFINVSTPSLLDDIFFYTWLISFGISIGVSTRVIVAFVYFMKISN